MRHSYETASLELSGRRVILGVCSCGRSRMLVASDNRAQWVYVDDPGKDEECTREDDDEDLLQPIHGFGPK